MARQIRTIVADTPVHVVQRGNNRMKCFGDEGDYLVYLALVVQSARSHACAVHSYCLMTNHIHMLLTPQSASSCGSFMHGISHRYAHYFNRKYSRTGTLWEGRFRSCLVQSTPYVLACHRYIELNPVRAGIVNDPGDYRWSSYQANTSGAADPLVRRHPEVVSLGASQYRRLFLDVLSADLLRDIREATNGGYPLAAASFKKEVMAMTGRKVTPGKPGRPGKKAQTGKSEPDPDLFSAGGAS
jgi:putative transposase